MRTWPRSVYPRSSGSPKWSTSLRPRYSPSKKTKYRAEGPTAIFPSATNLLRVAVPSFVPAFGNPTTFLEARRLCVPASRRVCLFVCQSGVRQRTAAESVCQVANLWGHEADTRMGHAGQQGELAGHASGAQTFALNGHFLRGVTQCPGARNLLGAGAGGFRRRVSKPQNHVLRCGRGRERWSRPDGANFRLPVRRTRFSLPRASGGPAITAEVEL